MMLLNLSLFFVAKTQLALQHHKCKETKTNRQSDSCVSFSTYSERTIAI